MAKKKKRSRFRLPAVSRETQVLAVVLLGLAGLSLLEPYAWFGALVGELGFHLACVAAIAGSIALLRRAYGVGCALVLFAMLFAWPLYPFYRATRPTPPAGPLLRVATAHVAGSELPRAVLAKFIAETRPDALAVTGLPESASIGPRFEGYRVVRGASDPRALLLVQGALAVPTGERAGEYPSATVRAGRCQARVVALELPPLAAYTALEARRRAIAKLGKRASAPRSIWLGHLGSRSQARDLSLFAAKNSLRSVRLGHGRLATAPASWGGLGFPLSDVLVHGWISVRETALGASLVAGAHRTLSAVVELTEARCRVQRGTTFE